MSCSWVGDESSNLSREVFTTVQFARTEARVEARELVAEI